MGRKHWGYIAAYAALVIGSGLAIIFGQKPLSSTTVSLALFGFNLAALMFLIPQTLEYIVSLKQNQSADTQANQANAENVAEVLQNTEILNDEIAKLSSRLNALENQLAQQNTTLEKVTQSQTVAVNATTELVALQTNTQNQISQLQEKVEQSQQAAQNQAQAGIPLTAALAGTSAFTPLTVKDLIIPTNANQSTSDDQALTAQQNEQSAAYTETEKAPQATQTQQLDLMDFSAKTIPNNTQAAANEESHNQQNFDVQPIRLQVRLSIGENDVICIRGEGGGLDWQEGIPMRDVEDDLWEWVSSPTDSPITCQVYLNDEIAAFGDDLTLTPGHTLQISPSFPQIEA